MKGNAVCRLLLITSSIVLWGQTCQGKKSIIIPTVVRKSANTEGMVCLLVSRGIGPLHLVNSDSLKNKFQKRNSKLGIPHSVKSLANLERYLEPAPAVTREFESIENEPLEGTSNGDGQFQVSRAEGREGIESSRNASSEPRVSTSELHERESGAHGKSTEKNSKDAFAESTRHASPESVRDFTSSHSHLQGGPVIHEDRIYHLPSDHSLSNSRKVPEENLSSTTLRTTIKRQNIQANSDRTSLLEPLTVSSPQHKVEERSMQVRQSPLLRPVKPENSRKVVQRNKPLVKVSLMVKAISGDVQFDGGEVVVDDRLLQEGMHTLQFEHVIEQNEHRLHVSLDGHRCLFEGSKRSRSPREFQFHEVWIKIQGPVTFVGNNSCENEQDGGSHQTSADPTDPILFPDEGEEKENDDETPVQDEAQTHPPSPASNLYPLKAIVNEVVNNRSMMHKIVINSTVSDSSLSLSYINNSKLINTAVDNSIVINAKVRNSTLVNSTLQNVHLINCEVINSRMLNSKSENTKIFNLLPYNATRNFGFDPLRDQITFEDLDEGPALDNASANVSGVDITMMVFGVLGLTVLVLVVVGVVLLVARRIIKRRKEMLLVRSAVMGSVKSW